MREEKVEKEAKKLLEELSRALSEIKLEETYYIVEQADVYREDTQPELEKEFREVALKNAPSRDGEGYFIAEVGTWLA